MKDLELRVKAALALLRGESVMYGIRLTQPEGEPVRVECMDGPGDIMCCVFEDCHYGVATPIEKAVVCPSGEGRP